MKKYSLIILSIVVFIIYSNINGQTKFMVVNTNNDGEGSLAKAIIDANTNPGADSIEFNIPGEGPHTIKNTTELPAITDPVSILGYSQQGAQKATSNSLAKLMIELDGSESGEDASGISIKTDSCKIEGLAVNNFGRTGIYINGTKNTIQGNYVGISIDGFQPKGNGFRSSDGYFYDGIWIDSSTDNLIGGIKPGDRNVISCNASSNIYIGEIGSQNNSIHGNYIGPAADGITRLENQSTGVIIFYALNNTIGGKEQGEGNVISGNYDIGVYLALGGGSTTIQGNLIGTDASGTVRLGNDLVGIGLEGSNNNIIGGDDPGSGNLVSGNGHKLNGGGIALTESSSDNIIQDNLIGTDITGTDSISNFTYGIILKDSDNNLVGGTLENEGNIISGSKKIGLLIQNAKNNTIKGNIIGLDYTGEKAIPNEWEGVRLEASSSLNVIGSNNPAERNVISGNLNSGITIWEPSERNQITGNFIGTNKNKSDLLPNGFDGISILGGSNNIIGGYNHGEGNVIAGNLYSGILVNTSNNFNTSNLSTSLRKSKIEPLSTLNKNELSTEIMLKKNHARPNNQLFLSKKLFKAANVNNSNSIENVAEAGYSNSILRNSIYANVGIGIYLYNINRENDNEDIDVGSNAGQNHPEIKSVTGDGTNATITYSVNSSTANSVYPLHVEFFIADTNGQGKVFLGSDVYTSTEAMTSKSFVFSPSISIGESELIVATATDSAGNTSEFSDPYVTTTVVGVNTEETLPDRYLLEQNYPNPFNPTTTIKYSIPNLTHSLIPSRDGKEQSDRGVLQDVQLKIYDILGKEVTTLVNKEQKPGNYEVHFDASSISSGVYYYILRTGNFFETKRMILLK